MKVPQWVGKRRYWQSRFVKLKCQGYRSAKIHEIIKEERTKVREIRPASEQMRLELAVKQLLKEKHPVSVIRANFGSETLARVRYDR